MADGGSVTVQFKADTRDFEAGIKRVKSAAASPMTGNFRNEVSQRIAEMQKVRAETDRLNDQVNAARTSAARTAAGFGLAGVAANVLGRNLSELGDKYSAAGRAGGFLANVTSGNVVGAFKALTATAPLAQQALGRLALDASTSAEKINEVAHELDLLPQGRAAKIASEFRALRQDALLAADAAREARDAFFSGLPGLGGKAGLAPFLSVLPSFGESTEFDRKFTGSLNKSLSQEIARAGTTPGKGDNISALKAGIGYLDRIKKDPRIRGDARTDLYLTLGALQDELTALTKKDTTATKKVVGKKKAQIKAIQDQLTAIDPSALVGGLGQGSWLTGPLMQYAESFGFKARPQDYVKDLKQQVRQGLAFQKNLGKIGGAGGSTNLLGELAGMGTQGQDIAAALAGKPGLVKSYSSLVDKRAAIAEKLQVTQMTAQIDSASIVVRSGQIIGVDRNGNGQLEKRERFTITNGGIPQVRGN